MNTLDGIEYSPEQIKGQIIFHYGPQSSSDYKTEITTVYSPSAEIQVHSIKDRPEDYFLVLRSDSADGLSDDEILTILRNGRTIALHIGHVNLLRRVIQKLEPVLSLYTLDELKKENQVSEDYLQDYLSRHSDQDAAKVLSTYQNILAGNHVLSGYVYCISDQLGHFKIGMSRKVDARLKQLATQPPFELTLIAAHHVYDMRGYEAAFHWLFRAKRLRGEWFALDEEDLQLFVDCAWPRNYMSAMYSQFGHL